MLGLFADGLSYADIADRLILFDAPDTGTAAAVHREAHGLVADEIHPVAEGACPHASGPQRRAPGVATRSPPRGDPGSAALGIGLHRGERLS